MNVNRNIPLQSGVMDFTEPARPSEFDRSPAAFAELYRQYLKPVYRYLYLKTGSPAEAEDLTSQVFLSALEGLPRYRHQGHFSAWLFSLARRKAADYYRSRKPQASLDEAETDPIAPEADLLAGFIHQDQVSDVGRIKRPAENAYTHNRSFRSATSILPLQLILPNKNGFTGLDACFAQCIFDAQSLKDALDEIDGIFRAPLALFYLEECPYHEIAQMLKIPLGTVKSRIARGIRQLKKLLVCDSDCGRRLAA